MLHKLARKNNTAFLYAAGILLAAVVLLLVFARARADSVRRVYVWGTKSDLTLSTQNIPREDHGSGIIVWTKGVSQTLPVTWVDTFTHLDLTKFPAGWESAMPLINGGFDTLVISDTNAPVIKTTNPMYFAPKPEGRREIHVGGTLSALTLTAMNMPTTTLKNEIVVWAMGVQSTQPVTWTNLSATVDTTKWPAGWESASPMTRDGYEKLVIETDAVELTANPTYFKPAVVVQPDPSSTFVPTAPAQSTATATPTPSSSVTPAAERRIYVWGTASALTLSTENIPHDDHQSSILVWAKGISNTVPITWNDTFAILDLTKFPAGWESAMPVINGGFNTLVIDPNSPVILTANPMYFGPAATPEPSTTPNSTPGATATPAPTPRTITVEKVGGELKFTANNIPQDEVNTAKLQVCTNEGCEVRNLTWSSGTTSVAIASLGAWVSLSVTLPDYTIIIEGDSPLAAGKDVRYLVPNYPIFLPFVGR